MNIRRLDSRDEDFRSRLASLAEFDAPDVEATVRAVVEDVRARGDAAVVELTNRFDEREVTGCAELEVPAADAARALDSIDRTLRESMEVAAARIGEFHEQQKAESWSRAEEDGTVLGQRVVPLDCVGIYVPGGRAAYPSSVLMNAIPARVAGVGEVVMTVPAPRGELDPAVLAAARLSTVDRIWTVGGAQAVAALAYGTESIPAVDKIVGPGNAWVSTAKRLVFGRVGIDSVAGPSEILVIADGTTPPEWVAADLCAQAEHDEDARATLVCPVPAYLDAVESELREMVPHFDRAAIIRASLERTGALVLVRDLEEAVDVANFMAPEHLELAVEDSAALAERVRHAGAVFLGSHSSEVLGDYCAGPNHVLPTGRSARFSSPLGVYDFQKRMNVIQCSESAARRLGAIAVVLAEAEGLTAHARSAAIRIPDPTAVTGRG